MTATTLQTGEEVDDATMTRTDEAGRTEKIREMARYIYRVYISEGIYYTNYADASARIKYNPDFIYRIGAMIEDEPMMSFAAFLAKRSENNGTREPGSLKELVHSVKWEAKKPVEPLISDFYLVFNPVFNRILKF